jgi:hypothetical protein
LSVGQSSERYWSSAEPALGITAQVDGTTRCHCQVENSKTYKTRPLSSHSTSTPRCHQRAIPIMCRRPGNPTWAGRATESSLAVHNGSGGTSFWNRNHSCPGVECLVQYRRGWSARICRPDRMMKIIRNRLKKCSAPTHHAKPWFALSAGVTMVPGLRSMNRSTDGMFRNPLAAATAVINITKPTGINHRRLNQRSRPTRTCGAVPNCWGIDPAHVGRSTNSSPISRLALNAAALASGVAAAERSEELVGRTPRSLIVDYLVGRVRTEHRPPANGPSGLANWNEHGSRRGS